MASEMVDGVIDGGVGRRAGVYVWGWDTLRGYWLVKVLYKTTLDPFMAKDSIFHEKSITRGQFLLPF
jgi:hypothetical protein